MMRKIISVFVLLFLSVVTVSAQGIKFFEGTWSEALAKAKKENKLIFVDCYANW